MNNMGMIQAILILLFRIDIWFLKEGVLIENSLRKATQMLSCSCAREKKSIQGSRKAPADLRKKGKAA